MEDLVDKIKNSPMQPKPSTHELLYAFGWKDHITSSLSDPALANHTKYNSFILTKENGLVKFKAKKLPQNPATDYVPKSGINLLKDWSHGCKHIGPADFRVDRINFDGIDRGIQKFLSRKPLQRKMEVSTSWDNLRARLEALPRRMDLKHMKLTEFPKQDDNIDHANADLNTVEELPPLIGDMYPEDVHIGCIDDEVQVNMDVCLYTKDKRWRPWMGRVVKLCGDGYIDVHWYKRRSRKENMFDAAHNPDGSPCIDQVSKDSVMFWMISDPVSRTENSFSVTSYSLLTIKREYETVDETEI